jgi:hypothetical protein
MTKVTADELIVSLAIPASALVGQRIAKKLLVENAAFTTADKRRINEGIEELNWVAALKPTSMGVPAYRDETREYLEIAVLSLALRGDAKADRLIEIVHRAVPYPVLLVVTDGESVSVSAAHKRHAQNDAAKVVLDDAVIEFRMPLTVPATTALPSMKVADQPTEHLFAMYQGWIDCLEAGQAAQITGVCSLPKDPVAIAARRQALAACTRLTQEITLLRSQSQRETQIARRVELNLDIKRLEAALVAAKSQL